MNAINSPSVTLRKVVLQDVDLDYADRQQLLVTDILRNKDYKFSKAERAALSGVRNLLAEMVRPGEDVAPVKVHRKYNTMVVGDINRARDLDKNGMSVKGIAEKLGYTNLVIARLLQGKTYTKFVYEPSEFAPPGGTA